jgi:stearoyl-CoA desaturase (delta-9 desaturase)
MRCNNKWIMNNMFKNINLLTSFFLIIYPLALIALGVHYFLNYQPTWFEFALFVFGYYAANIAVGVGLHRLWSHNAFKTNKVVEFILVLFAAKTLQGPVLSWVSNHCNHHTYTDKDKDPHTPLKYNGGVAGFLWAHIGWMLIGEGSYKSIDRVTMVKHGKNSILRWQLKHYYKIAIFMNTIFPAFIGYLIGGTLFSAYIGFLFIGLGRALQQQATFCVNSLCHFIGTKKYYKGTAGDIWWMALFLLGENWHNYHHAFPSDYRNGVKWYQFDVHKWIIYLMSLVGLATHLDRTPEVRIKAKMNETENYLIEKRRVQLVMVQSKVDQLIGGLYSKISEFESSSATVKNQLKKSCGEILESLNKLAEQLHSSIKLTEISSEKILKIANQKIKEAECFISQLCNEPDMQPVK